MGKLLDLHECHCTPLQVNCRHMPKADDNPPAPNIDPRVPLAAERTLLAWIRTSLALMGFGFVVARFGLFLRELAAARQMPAPQHSRWSLWVGMTLVLVGVVTTLAAALLHVRFMRKLARGELATYSEFPLAVVLCFVLVVVGIAMAIYLLTMH